jgi:uncharacterized protein YehS (DUF1456 family)
MNDLIRRIRNTLDDMEASLERIQQMGSVSVRETDLRLLLDAYEHNSPIDGGARNRR